MRILAIGLLLLAFCGAGCSGPGCTGGGDGPGEATPGPPLAPFELGISLEENERIGIAVDDSPAIVVGPTRFAAVLGDGSSPRIVENPVGYQPVFRDETSIRVPVAQGVFLVRGSDEQLVGVDVATLEVRWRVTAPTVAPPYQSVHLSSGDAFLVGAKDQIFALDPGTGEMLWQHAHEAEETAHQAFRAARGVLAVGRRRSVVGIEARTGTVRWTALDVRYGPRLFDLDEDRLPVLMDQRLAILDIDDGSVLWTTDLGAAVPWGSNVILQGDWLYATVLPSDGYARFQVRGTRWRGGEQSWTSSEFHGDDTGYHPSIALDDDALVVCTSHQATRAISLTTGEDQWVEHGAGCVMPIAWRPRPGASRILLLQPHGESVAYAHTARPRPARSVTIRGTVRCNGRPGANATVWVGDQMVQADEQGRFDRTLHASGSIQVFVHQVEYGQHDFCLAERRVVDGTEALSFDLIRGGGGIEPP